MDDKLSIISAVAAFAGAFFAFVGVFVAYKINDSVQAAECTRMYFSKEMLRAIRTLARIKISERRAYTRPEDIKTELHGRIKRDSHGDIRTDLLPFQKKPWTEQEDCARRLVKSYFQLAYELRFKRFLPISKNTLRRICSVDALGLYFTTVRWMEWKLGDGKYNKKPFVKLEEACRDIYEERYPRDKCEECGNGKEEDNPLKKYSDEWLDKYFGQTAVFMTKKEIEEIEGAAIKITVSEARETEKSASLP